MSLMRTTQRIGEAVLLRKSGFALLQVFLAFFFGTVLARAAVSETELKAAFLYNFAKFVDWPAQAFSSETDPIQIGIFGDEDFGGKLRSLLSDKKAHGRSFEVKKVSNPQEAKNFQIVFVSNTETKRLPQILEATKKLPILTIGESEQFLDAGGMINFTFEDSQLRFEVNPDAAERVKLAISSKLLRLAKRIKKGGKND